MRGHFQMNHCDSIVQRVLQRECFAWRETNWFVLHKDPTQSNNPTQHFLNNSPSHISPYYNFLFLRCPLFFFFLINNKKEINKRNKINE